MVSSNQVQQGNYGIKHVKDSHFLNPSDNILDIMLHSGQSQGFFEHNKLLSLWQVYTGVNPWQYSLLAQKRGEKTTPEVTDAIIHYISWHFHM